MNAAARMVGAALLLCAVSLCTAQQRVASPDTITPSLVRTKSPGLAAGLSAILPGAGQVYNESYWKIPIVVGIGGYFVYQILHNNRLYNDYQDQYSESLDTIPGGDPELLALREFYHDERDRFGWYFLILYALNILDAYVDASLFGFEVGDALAVRVLPGGGPAPLPGGTLAIRVRF